MTNTEKYNGWANRETWAFMLHLNNDQGLQEMAHEWARELFSPLATDTEPNDYTLGEYIIGHARKLWADHEKDLALSGGYSTGDPYVMWQREVGSVWRVDATEVGASLREDLDDD